MKRPKITILYFRKYANSHQKVILNKFILYIADTMSGNYETYCDLREFSDEDIQPKIDRNIEESDFDIAFISNNVKHSENLYYEIELAEKKQIKKVIMRIKL